MPTNPSDFDSYASGFLLNATTYSGGAGGTFTNQVSGQEDWTINGANPSTNFETRDGLAGMAFTNDATELIQGELYFNREMTVVMICEADTAGVTYFFGGVNTAANTFGVLGYSNQLQAFHSLGGSGYRSHTGSIAVAAAMSWNSTNGKYSTSVYDDTGKRTPIAQATDSDLRHPALNYWQMQIGGMRTTYLTGWIAECHIFNRDLHTADETALDDMLATLGAKVGL